MWSLEYEVSWGRIFLNMNGEELTDKFSTDDEMPRISASTWDINRVVLDEISCKHWRSWGPVRFPVERKENGQGGGYESSTRFTCLGD